MIFAYVDPSVMSYTIQAIAGLAIALGVVFGVFWRRVKRLVCRLLGRDENADKEREPPAMRLDSNDSAALAAADDAARALFARVAVRLVRPDRPRLRAGLTAGSIALYAALILPLQTFVQNTSNYDFSVWALLPELLLATVAVFGVFFALLALGERYLRGWLTPVAVAVLIAIYLNAGVLSMGIPELNGELPAELDLISRKVWDTALSACLLTVLIATFRWTRTGLHWVAVGVLALGLASLLDLRTDDRATEATAGSPGDSFAPVAALVDNLAYSKTRNVLMLVLDAMPGTSGVRALENDAALRAHFPGFTCDRQNVGMHDRTERAVPGMFTGEYYDMSRTLGAYMMTSLGTNSFLRTYQAHGDAVYSMLDFFTYGLTTEPMTVKADATEPTRPLLLRPAREIPHLPLANVVAFRLLPFVLKGPLLRHDIHKLRVKANFAENSFEHILYPKLAARPFRTDGRQVLAKFHTHGAHGPYCYELDGSPAKPRRDDLTTVNLASSNVLVHVGRLMDAWRKNGLYDRSFIVVCADHGRTPADPFPGNPRASAFLMVKPDGASGPLDFSDAPTGHQNLCALMKTTCGKRLSAEEVTAALSASRRVYREYDRQAKACRDWIYHADGRVEEGNE